MTLSYQVIGRNIRNRRIHSGLTQEQASELLGLSALHYGRLERGQHRASLDQLAMIAQLFNTSIEHLLSGASDCVFSTDARSMDSFASVIALLALGCSDEARSLMLDTCQLIARHDKQLI